MKHIAIAFITLLISLVSVSGHIAEDIDNKFICCISATKSEKEAQKSVNNLVAKGHPAAYLWIPDYDGLSGKELYLVYIGPYANKAVASAALERLKRELGNKSIYIKNVGNFVEQGGC